MAATEAIGKPWKERFQWLEIHGGSLRGHYSPGSAAGLSAVWISGRMPLPDWFRDGRFILKTEQSGA